MSEVKVTCNRCKAEFVTFLNRLGKDSKKCEKCLSYHRDFNRRWLANESDDHRVAKLKKMAAKYWSDEVHRESIIKAAIAYSQVDSKCPACSKPMKKGSLSPHIKICKAMYVPTVRESILRLG